MDLDAEKTDLLQRLAREIDGRADAGERQSLHNLSSAMYGRVAAEDIYDRSLEDLYGCLNAMLRFMRRWPQGGVRALIFNASLQTHGWQSPHTVVAALCPGIPFCTVSVRAELNRRNLMIHNIISANLGTHRDASGELREVLRSADSDESPEALLFFEIERHANPAELDELRDTLVDILGEVFTVVSDYSPVCERLQDAAAAVAASDCVERDLRDEAVAFLQWLERDHMTLLGYEYLTVDPPGSPEGVAVREGASLGLLRLRSTRGVEDLASDLRALPAEQLLQKQLSFSKSRHRSRVHRTIYPDYVEVKDFDDQGRVVGQHRFIGLYTAAVYNMHPRQIPIVRRKLEHVITMSNLGWSDHQSRELLRVLHLFPRDELFQSSSAQLCETVNAINSIQERQQTRLFIREDVHGKFVNCIVYLPRENYDTELRRKIESILGNAFRAEEMEFTTFYSESVLVRIYFVLRVNPAVPLDYDTEEILDQIKQAMLSWEDQLHEDLIEEFGEERGEQIARDLGRGFSAGYRDDFDTRTAVEDIHKFLLLVDGAQLAMNLYRPAAADSDVMHLRLYHSGSSLPLSDVLPILENLGLRVVTERPYSVRARDGGRYWLQEFSLVYSLAGDIDVEKVKEEFEDAFALIWFGEAENDSFNRLLIGTRLNWREIALLRAYARYLRQLLFPHTVEYMAETMAHHLNITAAVVELFLTRFSPLFDGDEAWRTEREAAVEKRILDALEAVPNLGEDRIIRQYLHVVKATLRTNFFQNEADGELKSYFSFKLSPADIPEVPAPVPAYEIYVYSPRMEGVHLRGGKVARGGLRWSDRLEDFRTEVLGLVKAQQVKNAVIVPVGAKGGFVARRAVPGMSRAELQEEGQACYRLFIRGLLDVTDNRRADSVARPPMVVAKDDDDPYLVVAADKGTATFSDIANAISADYDFWLGDAFASGGSAGYDHKSMGITARGAWVSVQRHFRELGIDVQSTDVSVVGIGDMSGDVFGNGMLLSEHIELVAAFNHMHIFVDPDPDPAVSFAERRRLFDMPRSSWSDYDPQLISSGGGVFERAAKSITLSPQIKERFDIARDALTPAEFISYLLRARVDLLWNGGIGTYVKSSLETHMDVGDKTNDGLRIDADELRCKVVGEGGNLGVTQLARVEYSLGGGRCNTDFIDNAGGVDCSDHEVNIKILLNAVIARGELGREQRDALLERMTESVAGLVLRNNYHQTQAITLVERQAHERANEYQRFIRAFEESGDLNRQLEFLPADEELHERRAQGSALTRPELSVLISYEKATLKKHLMDVQFNGDRYVFRAAESAFPEELIQRYPRDIREHRLHREIVATQIANDIVNRMGLNFVQRQRRATGAPIADVARAYAAVLEIYRLRELWQEIEALDHRVSSDVQMEMMLTLIRLVKRSTRWLLRNRRRELAPGDVVEQFRGGIEQLRGLFPDVLRGDAADAYRQTREYHEEQGVPGALAAAIAGAHHAYSALGVVQGAQEAGATLLEVANLYYLLGERLELDWFAGQIIATRVDNEWQALARDSFLEDLEWQQRTLAIAALRHREGEGNLVDCLERWETGEAGLLQRWREMLVELRAGAAPDFAMLAVANRELLDLAQSSARGGERPDVAADVS